MTESRSRFDSDTVAIDMAKTVTGPHLWAGQEDSLLRMVARHLPSNLVVWIRTPY
jgi:hypothetical protein